VQAQGREDTSLSPPDYCAGLAFFIRVKYYPELTSAGYL